MISSEVLIQVKGLSKRYGDVIAIDGVDFKVYRGECVGFLGPNGADKTTTVRMLYCFLPPTSGELWIAGLSVATECRQIKSLVGVAP